MSSRSRPSARRLLALLLLTGGLLTTTSSCGPTPLEQARNSIARGDLTTASALLAGETGFAAESERERIATLAADRAAAEREVEACLLLANSGEKREALARLDAFKRGLKDRRAKETIAQAESDIVDLVPKASSASPRRSKAPEPSAREAAPEVTPEAAPSLAERSAARARAAADQGDWKLALSLLGVALKRATGENELTLRELQSSIQTRAAAQAATQLTRARELESTAGLDAALRFARNAERVMPASSAAPEIQALREFTNQAGGSVEPPARSASPRLTPSRLTSGGSTAEEPAEDEPEEFADADPIKALMAARLAEDEGRIFEALELYEALTMELPDSPERDLADVRSLSLKDRAALRSELSLAFAAEPNRFSEWGITGIDGDRITFEGCEQALLEAPKNKLQRMMESLSLTSQARAGWYRERLSLGDKGVLRDLGRSSELGEVSPEHAWGVVAEARGEMPPEEGYIFEAGEWHSSAQAAAEVLAAQVSTFERALVRARTAEREGALKDVLSLGRDGVDALKRALAAREEEARSVLTKGRVLAQLERLAEQRAELDAKREKAIGLIFDEEEYFYPYNPPECPPERAKLYPGVQRRVDELVTEVRSVWQASKSVKVSDKFTEGLAELDWIATIRRENNLAASEIESLPDWIDGLPRRAEKVDLVNFGWNEQERKAVRYARAVRAFNEAHWKSFEDSEKAQELGETSIPSTVEREQVRATNDYRVMFGRRPVAWNPVVQVAAQGHSDWMSLTGKYSHYNDEDPKLHGPGDRMRVAGYNRGISENLSRGNSGPRDAHDGWAHSSGHHRNLLMPGHREMASALAGSLWTQNFGVDDAFLEALEEWYD